MAADRGSLLLTAASALAGLATAWLVVAVAGGRPSPPALPPPPEGYSVVRTDRYDLYAPSRSELTQGAEELERAVATFRRYFDASPTRLVVFEAAVPGAFREIDLRRFDGAEGRFLPFLTEVRRASRGDRRIGSRGRSPPSPSGADEAGPGGSQGRPREPPEPGGGPGVLAHEACHVFLDAWARQAADPPRERPAHAYGSGVLPDWFDEMAATLCERAGYKRTRRRYLRSRFDRRIPLRELVTMPHPVAGDASPELPPTEGLRARSLVKLLDGSRVATALDERRAGLYYAQALTLGEFLHERGGARALRTVGRHLAEGRDLERALELSRRKGIDVPGDLERLERRWLEWGTQGGPRARR